MGEGIERGQWNSQLQFILTLVGYSIGLGNVWRFPYLCYQYGGGSFLVPYCCMLAGVGLPLYFMESSVAQYASLGAITIWRISPIFKGLGISMLVFTTGVSIYYVIIIAWTLYFLFSSMTSELPFADCTHEWNTERCITAEELQPLTRNKTALELELTGRNLTHPLNFTTPSEEFFYNKVLQMSSGIDDIGGVVWELALCLLLAWIVIFLVIVNGVKSLGKVSYVGAIFPYIMMTALLIRGVTLEGASTGVEFYIKPEISELGNLEAWSDAATQILYSLALAQGGLLALASYNNFNNNTLRDSIVIPFLNCGTSVYVGFAVFSVLGYLAESKGVPISQVATGGPGLVFVVYPEALTQMPAPVVWAILFFLMLLMLGFSTMFATIETVFTAIQDEFAQVLRKTKVRFFLFRGVFCAVCYLISLCLVTEGGFYLFTLMDHSYGSFPLLFSAFFFVLIIGTIYGYGRFSADIELMIGKSPNMFYKICWLFVTPAILLCLIIVTSISYEQPYLEGYTFPSWSRAIGWLIQLSCMLPIPGYAIYKILKDGGWKIIKNASQPSDNWGPADSDRRHTTHDIESLSNKVITETEITPTKQEYDNEAQAVVYL